MMALSPPITPQGTLIRLAKNQAMPTIYDVEMEGIDQLQQYDRVECHTVLYPYSRQVSSEDISFYPFEEYVSDLASHQRSAYAEIHSPSAQICGLLLGGIIALVFGVIALVGGVNALRRRRWGLALAGAILSLPLIPVGTVLGILAIIFLAMGKKEFS